MAMTGQTKRESKILEKVSPCRFCGDDSLTASHDIGKVKQHSHRADVVTTIRCDSCGGEFRSTTNKMLRSRSLPRPQDRGYEWRIPENYILVTCAECGAVVDDPCTNDESNRELFERLVADELRSGCCSAECEIQEGTYANTGGR